MAAGNVHTVDVKNLIVPSTVGDGNRVSVTLTVVRLGDDGSDDTQMEVSKTVLFTVGDALPDDETKPVVTGLEFPQRCSDDEAAQCSTEKWEVKFGVQVSGDKTLITFRSWNIVRSG